MTRKRAMTIAAVGVSACACVMAIAYAVGDRRHPPCGGEVNGKPDGISYIEVQRYTKPMRNPRFVACCTIDDADRVAQIDAFLRESASAWKPLDGAIAAEPVARYALVRKSGSREEVTLVSNALVTPEWILPFSYDDYLMFEALIEDKFQLVPIIPPRSSPSPLTWMFKVIGVK